MSREKELAKNAAILSLGTFFPKFLTILITPILTAQLQNQEYGQYDLITTIESLLLPAVTLQISSAAFRFLIDKKEEIEEQKEIISTIYAFVIPTSMIASLIYYLIVRDRLGVNGILIILYFLGDIMLKTTQQIMRGLGKNLMYSVSSIIRAAFTVGLIIVFTGVFTHSNYGLAGTVTAMFLAVLFATGYLMIQGKLIPLLSIRAVSLVRLKELLNYSWPMVPNNLSGWVLKMSDRLVITAVLGLEANAMYAVATKLPAILGYFQNTFSMAWQENASIAYKDDDKQVYYSKMCNWVYCLTIGVLAGLIMCTPIIWRLLVRGNYEEAYVQVPVLYIAMLFQCMSLTIGGIYIAHKKTKSIGITTMIAAAINLLTDILLVHSIGIWAGSISTLISYLFLLVYRMYDVQKFQKIDFHVKKILLGVLLLVGMSLLSALRNPYTDLVNILICILILVIFDRDIIRWGIKLVWKKVLKGER